MKARTLPPPTVRERIMIAEREIYRLEVELYELLQFEHYQTMAAVNAALDRSMVHIPPETVH